MISMSEKPEGRGDTAPNSNRELDIHDTTIQALYGAALHLESCIQLLEQSPEHAKAGLDGVVNRLNELISDLRNRIYELNK